MDALFVIGCFVAAVFLGGMVVIVLHGMRAVTHTLADAPEARADRWPALVRTLVELGYADGEQDAGTLLGREDAESAFAMVRLIERGERRLSALAVAELVAIGDDAVPTIEHALEEAHPDMAVDLRTALREIALGRHDAGGDPLVEVFR